MFNTIRPSTICFALAAALFLPIAAQASGPDAPDIIDHGMSYNASSRTLPRPECDFSGDGLDFYWVAFSDGTCFGWSTTHQCDMPWSLCDTSLGLLTMQRQASDTSAELKTTGEQMSLKAPELTAFGNWKGWSESETAALETITWEEALVLANGINKRMSSSSESFNAFEWESAAGATAYYCGAADGAVAKITRTGKHVCDPTPDEVCDRMQEEEL